MFKLFKKKTDAKVDKLATGQQPKSVENAVALPKQEPTKDIVATSPAPNLQDKSRQTVFAKLKASLGKTKTALQLSSVDNNMLEQFETALLKADVGYQTTKDIIARLQEAGNNKQDVSVTTLQAILLEILQLPPQPSVAKKMQAVIVVGVNGSGKTTSVSKLAHYYQQQHKKVVLVAADTFRAAAEEQLVVWGKRNSVAVVTAAGSKDPSSVVYKGLSQGLATTADLVIIDTAGRLHTQVNLMAELKKIRRVADKFAEQVAIEVVMVLDASIGQNAVNQLQEFNAAVAVDKLIVSKLDGTAKGGIIFNLCSQFKIPVAFIGVGEQLDDLIDFDAEEFIKSIVD